MTDAILIAALGAVFNAGVMWASLKFILWRQDRTEKETKAVRLIAERAHSRIDKLRAA